MKIKSLRDYGFYRYGVSACGKVFFKKDEDSKWRERKIKPRKRDGYIDVRIRQDTFSCKKSVKVHRLVAMAFIPNPKNKPFVNHKDGNPANNNVSNLEWVDHAQNIRHAVRTGILDNRGENCHQSKIDSIKALTIGTMLRSGFSVLDITTKDHSLRGIAYNISLDGKWKHLFPKTWYKTRSGKRILSAKEKNYRHQCKI
jgi:hypothetical protein